MGSVTTCCHLSFYVRVDITLWPFNCIESDRGRLSIPEICMCVKDTFFFTLWPFFNGWSYAQVLASNRWHFTLPFVCIWGLKLMCLKWRNEAGTCVIGLSGTWILRFCIWWFWSWTEDVSSFMLPNNCLIFYHLECTVTVMCNCDIKHL